MNYCVICGECRCPPFLGSRRHEQFLFESLTLGTGERGTVLQIDKI